MSDLQTLRTNVRSELKADPSGRIWSDSTLNRYIVEAVNKIQQDASYDWPFNDGTYSVPSIIGTREYALPADFARMELNGIKYDTGMLTMRDFREVFDFYDLTQQGTPGIYYIRGSVFGVISVPDAIKTMAFLYRKALTPMSADNSDSGMPTEFNQAIQSYAEYLCWNQLTSSDSAQKAQQALSNYSLSIQGLYARFLGRRDEANFRFDFQQVTPSSW